MLKGREVLVAGDAAVPGSASGAAARKVVSSVTAAGDVCGRRHDGATVWTSGTASAHTTTSDTVTEVVNSAFIGGRPFVPW